MVVSYSEDRVLAQSEVAARAPQVVWHDIECGSYTADLPLWRELAAEETDRAPGAILDVGAGTGRVTRELLNAGHHVTALDLDGDLLDALRERADGPALHTVRADARAFVLDRGDFALCIAAMQTVQLLAGTRDRLAFLRRARAHLRPGGLLACAIVTDLQAFDCAAGDAGPSPEFGRFAGRLYLSRATRVRTRMRSLVIERERRIFSGGHPPVELAAGRDAIELARLDAPRLEEEGVRAGFTPEAARWVPATEDHLGSAVVMLRA